MPQMRVTVGAEHLGSARAMAEVGLTGDIFRGDRREKAGPTGAGIKLGRR